MAESVREVFDKKLPSVKKGKSFNMECAVCLQTCIHPAELPCGHIFCYLCIKGIVNQGRRCAMCRRDIPVDYLDKPKLINPVDVENSNQGFEDGHLWFYKGHNGWWQYDERTSLELESAYQKGERCCELLIAGFLYVADFDEMLQYRRNDPSRRRRIKRDLATTSKKGVAGLKTEFAVSDSSNSTTSAVNDSTHAQSSNVPETTNPIPVAPVFPNSLTRPVYTQRARGRTLLGLSPQPTCSTTPSQNTSSNADNLTEYSRNFDFDNVIHETLDWTIEQIESLNLELLNDYEDLIRDVNHYGQLHGNLNQSRSGRVVDNFLNWFLSRRNQLRESFEDEPMAYDRIRHVSGFSNENNAEPPPVPPHEIPSTSETDPNESAVLTDSDTPPEPPLRGTSRRRNLRRSKSLNHEMCNSKIS